MTSRYVLTKLQDDMLLFKNPYSQYFSDVVSYLKVAMLDEEGKDKSIKPTNIEYNKDNNSVVIKFMIEPLATRKLVILFGATDKGYSVIQNIVEKYSDEQNILKEYDATIAYWKQKVTRSFDTADQYLNIMANGWLSYQAIACRLFARTALYQAGGAFGYRDQLQDSLALISTWPEFTRSQIIKHSTKQFAQGDVLHWWHEHNGAGIRTLFSDDYLWLPYVLSEYVEKTRDYSILDVRTPFLEDKPLLDRREIYDVFNSSNEIATIYQHALRAIQYGLSRKGRNNLLSIGDGDWCDGYSNIRGESVWVTLFMIDILERFANIAAYRGDDVTKLHFLSDRNILKNTVMDVAYKDGYFIRAFYPDGTPLGSKDSEDCKIDLIAQTWAAIALKDYPDCKEAIQSALNMAEKYLVDRVNNVIKLLYPPFDNPVHDPGYIKAYVPGVRENGGQYTHAAIWLAKAYFEIGEREKGLDILKIICPIYHSDTKQKADIYKVEPYVVAADVYATKEHIGRGGWTWYTGSAAWLYKVIEDSFEQVINVPDEKAKEEALPKKRGRKPKNTTA